MSTPRVPPWKRKKKTGGPKKTLTPAQVAAARRRAQDHGRRYPNLVDNMWAARLKAEDLAPKRGFDDFDPDSGGRPAAGTCEGIM